MKTAFVVACDEYITPESATREAAERKLAGILDHGQCSSVPHWVAEVPKGMRNRGANVRSMVDKVRPR